MILADSEVKEAKEVKETDTGLNNHPEDFSLNDRVNNFFKDTIHGVSSNNSRIGRQSDLVLYGSDESLVNKFENKLLGAVPDKI